MAAAARLGLLDVKDDALFHMIGFFTHGDGKIRFTRVSRRARELARGGRYDGIGDVFGAPRPATGFSADINELLASA